jgi:D-alanyl-D-alanine endopeptidase (penicillin-binding protein 7)
MTFSLQHTVRVRRIWKYLAAAGFVLANLQPPFVSWDVHAAAGAAVDPQSADSTPSSTRPAPPVPPAPSPGPRSNSSHSPDAQSRLAVRSKIALVEDANTSEVLLAKKADQIVPIASITKLMTAIVALDANLPLEDMLKISDEDCDPAMGTASRLRVGWSLTRADMLHLALMSSENRAAAALSRYYPGGRPAFIQAMNAKAAVLGMSNTHFANPNGLTKENVSTAFDLVKLLQAACEYPLIREYTTDRYYYVQIGRWILPYVNTNRLIGRPDWDIEVQKTGFISDSGECLVMRVNLDGRSLIMVFLDSYGKLTRFADARRVRMQLALAKGK